MPAVQALKDDWTPAKLKDHHQWRKQMFAVHRPKIDPLAQKIQVVKDPEKAATETRMRDLEMVVVSLRSELDAARKEIRRQMTEAASDREPVEGVVKIRLERVIQVVAIYYGFTVRDMKSARRTKDICAARHVAAYLCKELTLRSLPEIGRHMGGRDHTTSLHSIKKITAQRLTDARLCQELVELEAMFAEGTRNVQL